jgi:ABC-type Fe3+ transport system permease subunit
MEELLQPLNLLGIALIIAVIVIPVRLRSILNELRKQTQSLEEIAKRLPPPQVK